MNIVDQRILITGATGGIGSELAMNLGVKGAKLILVGTDVNKLNDLKKAVLVQGGKAQIYACDFSIPNAPEKLADQVINQAGGIDILINCAGVTHFGLFDKQTAESLEMLWRINVVSPMQLTRLLLPTMVSARHGQIVNIGSIFGSIGFAYFATYSASKFAIRGFSEALRRELEGSGVGVTYVAPRYTKTPLNNSVISKMAVAVGMNTDEPFVVAQHVVRAIEKDSDDYYIGWPESLFVRINAIFPRLIDNALRKQNTKTREFTL
ncbi:SDR family oxidoreductase [Sulfuriferula nivalis]|uniref:Short chain dehydrogenase n=1 Tax=Sulfuriferula nivalis TaxID=2675298 RepID=A0A809S1I3_9PROT|nr:SDR family oxidoreductase [Sulfuriferula nivalis]BBP00428.1 short chain dehydrogenase [Sulfuriferula nivalis]